MGESHSPSGKGLHPDTKDFRRSRRFLAPSNFRVFQQHRPRPCGNVIFLICRILATVGKRSNGARVRPTNSASDGLHERPHAEDIDHPLHVIGEHLQTHFRFDLLKGLGQEIGAAHPRLEGSERMLNGLSTNDHGLRHAVEPGLHPVEHRFVLPAFPPFDLVSRALGFEPARWAPVWMQTSAIWRF